MSPLDTLKHGRDLLVVQGWGQDHYAQLVGRDADGQSVCTRCAYGALEGWTIGDNGVYEITVGTNFGAQFYLKWGMAVVDSREEWLNLAGEISIVDWNDAPGRTAGEVIAAFNVAIELAQAAL
jgi:hypothetical protein